MLARITRRKIRFEHTIVVTLLEIHVHDSSRPNTSHLVAIESSNFGEWTWLNVVATILSEESWDAVLLEFLGISAPRVDVISPEIDGLLRLSAVKVVLQFDANILVIVGGISNTNLTVTLCLDVCLGITNSSLDESTGVCVGWNIGNLVTSKETHNIVILLESIDNTGVGLECGLERSWIR
jgi:hypothetical protein